MKDPMYRCPKCDCLSGDSWEQCEKACPIAPSPHYSEAVFAFFGGLVLLSPEEMEVQP